MSTEELSEASDRSMSSREDLTLEDTEETGGRSGEEEAEEGVAVAQPPRDSTYASTQAVALTGSSALDILDQLLSCGKIGKERAARLQRKYNLTKEALESSRALENTLLVKAKELGQSLSQQQHVLEKAATFPEGDNSEVSRLRQVLLQHQNDLDQSRERAEKLDREHTRLSEERDEVEREWARLPKKEELEQHLRNLTRQTEELRDEATQRSQDVKRYQDDLDTKNYRIADIMQETEELREVEEKLQDELTALRTASLNVPRELDSLRKRKVEVQAQTVDRKAFLQELQLQIDEVSERMQTLQHEQLEAEVKLREEEDCKVTHELHLERLSKDLSTAKEREATLLEDSATMELRLRHRSGEHRLAFEALSARTKEKDRELKLLKKAELQLNTLRQSLEQLKQKGEGLEEKVRVNTQELEEGRCRREELLTEVQQLSRNKALQDGLSSEDISTLENKQAEEQRLRTQAKAQQDRTHDLSKDIITMTKTRDRDSRDYYKAKYQQQTIADNLKTKVGEIEEQKKRIRELEGRLQDFAQAYDVVKTERNKTHSQIQLMHKLTAELEEKCKILENEVDILRVSVESKEKLLQKCSVVQSSKVQERDTQRQELDRVKGLQAEASSGLETQREELHKLTQQATTAEQNLNGLRRHYEQAVQERNNLGLQLIERNEEVCVFYEKQHMQEAVLRKANMELGSRQEEIRFLKMELSRVQNDLLVGRKTLPSKERLEAELVAAQIELKEENTRLSSLERAVECASDPTRLRLLPGNNPTLDDLREKTEALEAQLAEREQQLLEKELLYEQVCQLTERAGKRAESQRGATLQVAGKVGHYQGRIRDTTRKMMALVSELSMQQASALRLQQEVQEAEAKLEQAYRRVEAGEAPDQEAATHWQRELHLRQRRQWDCQAKRQLAEMEETHQLPGGTVTSAEPRPNAYMPLEEGDLPIPKPYGSHAPFKPTQPGANIRHIRKPQPQPIDI